MRGGLSAHPPLQPIEAAVSFKQKAYSALKNAIVSMDIYRNRDEIRLDERKLAQDFAAHRCVRRWRNSKAKASCAPFHAAASTSCARLGRK
jgi:hypothetical protein